MKKVILLIYLFSICLSLQASNFVDLGKEIRIPLPKNWQVAGDSGFYPFQIINDALTAELLIYKSIIDKSEAIHTNQELKESVDIIISDIIMTLPEAKLLSSTGKIDDNRAIFSLDFISVDTITNGQIHHRLNGYLYDHPNGEQILFTLWGKTSNSSKDLLHKEILLMQNNFSFYGESNGRLFQTNSDVDWKVLVVILVLILAVLLFFRKHKAIESIQFSEDSHFWRCSCVRQNHMNNLLCKRCGQQNNIKESV